MIGMGKIDLLRPATVEVRERQDNNTFVFGCTDAFGRMRPLIDGETGNPVQISRYADDAIAECRAVWRALTGKNFVE